MGIIIDAISWILLMAGIFFCLTGAMGLLRLPDFFTRIHAAGITESLGAGCILIGLMLQAGWGLVFAKLMIILLFSVVAGTTANHAMAKAAIKSGMKPKFIDDNDN